MKNKVLIIAVILLSLCLLAGAFTVLNPTREKTSKDEFYVPVICDSIKETYNKTETLGDLYFAYVPNMNQLRGFDYVNNIIGSYCIAKLTDGFYYSKHINTETSDTMYVIYEESIISSFWYTSRWFNVSDFKSIGVGSSYDDVLAIDSSLKFKMKYDYYQKTYHLCDSGYLIITWSSDTKNPKVESTEYVHDELINSLFLLEQTSKNG